jgi:hypothetical protein
MIKQQSYVDAILDSMHAAEAHLPTEYQDDVDLTIATVTPRTPTYCFMPEPGRITVITDPVGVREFYISSRLDFRPMTSRIMTHIASDFYVFQENVPTRRILADGSYATINTAMVFPNAGDGIQGEFLWERYPGEEEAPAVPSELGPLVDVPTLKLRNAKIHERYLQRLRSGNSDAVAETLADDCLWAVRSYLPDAEERPIVKAEGKAQVLEVLGAWHEAFELERLSVLTRLATEWYVFADELYTVRPKSGPDAGELREYRKASIYPIGRGGFIQGELGYGSELTVPSERSEREVGAITWPRPEFTEDLCEPTWA